MIVLVDIAQLQATTIVQHCEMTSSFGGMDFNVCVNSPSERSPSNAIFSNDPYLDSISDSSNSNSPHVNQIVFNANLPYEMYPYSTTTYFPTFGSAKPTHDMTEASVEKDRRRKRSESSSKSSEKESNPNTHMRRRAQNRASQRAFRERKEKHVKGLEYQLEDLHEKHQDLLQSYTKQVDQVARLNARIADLSAELNLMRHCQEPNYSELITVEKFDKFDAFSSTGLVSYQPNETYYDKGPTDMNTDFPLDLFEDSL